jgi:glycosyltransferase involved in cell wall biosynthesis
VTATLTIFLPVRNGGDYLSNAIESIRAQTDCGWRLIVLDNYSSDDTVARVHAADDVRINLDVSPQPLSITDSWRRILPLSAGLAPESLMTMIGHDDLLNPHFVATIKQLAAEDPDATLYQTQFELIDSAGKRIRPARPVPLHEEAGDLLAALCWGVRDSFGTGYAFRAGDYVRVGGIPSFPRLLYADHLLFTRLTALGHKRCAASLGCSYRLHRGSASNGLSAARLGDHACALALFVRTIDADFGDFARTDRGRFAMTYLLDQELGILKAPGVQRTLSLDAQLATAQLGTRLAALVGEAPQEAWPHRASKRLLYQARRWSITLRLLRQRLGGHA